MRAGATNDLALYARLLRQARPYWSHLAALLVLNLLATPLALLAPVPLKLAVDSVIGKQQAPAVLRAVLPPGATESPFGMLGVAAGLLVLVSLLSQAQKLGAWLLSTYTGERLVLDFRAALFRHVQRLSLLYHDTRGTSDSTYRIQYDAAAVQWIALDGMIPLVSAVVTLVATFMVVGRLNWELAAAGLVVAPVLFFVTWFFRSRLRDQWKEVKQLESGALKVVQEVLSAVRVVKAFGQEEREQDRFCRRSGESLRARLRVVWSECAFSLLIGMTTAAGTAAVLYIGVRHVLAGTLTLGELLLAMAYLGQLYDPLQTISKKITAQQSTLVSAERAFSLLDETPDVEERPNARPLVRASGTVTFQEVAFAYQPGQPVLEQVSFAVPAGTRVGIAGKTGAGKSTLINILCRFYDPASGAIFLDGMDLRDYRLSDLRNQFAIVLQEPVLFDATLAENIAYAKPGATEAEIIAAARAANVHEFISGLPDGYGTEVGERGVRLSGGERQRVSLARAFLKDAPILILDEPTSSVDVKTEAAIMEAMERLMEGRTTFMIAHRLSTLEHCDLVLRIERGRLVSADTPAQVLAATGAPAILSPQARDVQR